MINLPTDIQCHKVRETNECLVAYTYILVVFSIYFTPKHDI